MDGREACAVPGRDTVMHADVDVLVDSALAYRIRRQRGGIVGFDAALPNIH
jgi:hypothetical protein